MTQLLKISLLLKGPYHAKLSVLGYCCQCRGQLQSPSKAKVSYEAELAQTKSKNADRLTEVMQRSEQSMQNKAELESRLKEVKGQLEEKERELEVARVFIGENQTRQNEFRRRVRGW